MKKSLIALAVLGTTAGIVHAQSNVTIYGVANMGYSKTTGSKLTASENTPNRLGFMGSEDLGGGLKTTFQLEERFKLYNGVTASRGAFEGAANVGLAGNNWGQVRLGRVNELATETYRKIDPFNQEGVGAMPNNVFRGMDTEGRLSSTTRYDSPSFNGFQFGLTYSVKNQNASTIKYNSTYTAAANAYKLNDGYGLSATYSNGPLFLLTNYNVAADSNDSYNWNIGGLYAFGPAKIGLGYEATKNKLVAASIEDEKRYIVSATYNIGAGIIKAAYNHTNNYNFSNNLDADKLAFGYTHNLSKRTALYAEYSHLSVDKADGVNAIDFGITHKF